MAGGAVFNACEGGQVEMYNGKTGRGVCADFGLLIEDAIGAGCIAAVPENPSKAQKTWAAACITKWAPTGARDLYEKCQAAEKSKKPAKPTSQDI